MDNLIDIKVPTPPAEVLGVNEKFIVVPPLSRSGKYVRPGDLLFSLDTGPVILEVESKYQGLFESREIIAGNLVVAEQLVGTINQLAPEPRRSKFNVSNVVSFVLGVLVTSVAFLVFGSI